MMRKIIALASIIFLGLILRLYGINWDQGFHLHPDERMLIMVADRIHLWDKLNPDFFNYGSLPVYLLKGTSQLLQHFRNEPVATYDGMLIIGRTLSVIFDLGTLIVVFASAKLLFKNPKIAYISAFLYAISFFPIQNTHFFVVDVFLTFFVTLTLYFLLLYMKNPRVVRVVLISIAFAAALTTKVTALLFLPVILLTLFFSYFSTFKKSVPWYYRVIPSGIICYIFINIAVLCSFIFMPYAFISYKKFIDDVTLQTTMSKDPYIFPYTLQYVYTLPYLYYLKNIALWGLGPVLFCLSLVGASVGVISSKYNNIKSEGILNYIKSYRIYIVFTVFYLIYFVIIGRSAVKFMRYMLPLYPFFVILAGYGLVKIKEKFQTNLFILPVILCLCLWTLSFVSMYSHEHSRITASKWILSHISKGSTIAVEHWDDRLPIYGGEIYNIVEMTLYDLPDNDLKWSTLNETLKHTDYIVLASNRLYTPLPKLADCQKYVKCYPKTAKYYENLFAGKLGFVKVAEFEVKPTLPFLNMSISDQSADESFTVYDHPKILIFKKL